MSSQRALTDYAADDDPEWTPETDTGAKSAWQPRSGPQCVCGASVDAEAARVVGIDGVVPACPACWADPQDNARYRTVVKAVVSFSNDRATGRGGGRRPDVEVDASLHPEVDG